MRGLHSTLAVEHGVTGHAVAASLGHESVSTVPQSFRSDSGDARRSRKPSNYVELKGIEPSASRVRLQ
jgi:hypothetical protein